MTYTALFPGLVAVARAVVYSCSAFWLFGFVETQQMIGFQLFPFLMAGLLCYLLLYGFLRSPRPLPAVVGAGVFLTAAVGTILIRRFAVFTGPLSLCLGVVFLAAVIIRAIQVCTAPITAAQSISALERCTGFFLAFLWFQGSAGMPSGYSVPLMVMSLLSLVAVLYQRLAAGSERDTSRKWLRGLIAVAAILLLIVAAVYLFFTYGAAPMAQVILTLYSGARYVLSLVWRGIYAFLTWLASFVSDPEPQELPEAMPSFTPEELPESALPDQQVYVIAAIAGVTVFLVVVPVVLFRLRRLRIRGHIQTAKKGRTIRRRIPLLRWLQQLWTRITNRLRLRMAILTMRGTPQELYYFLTRAGRRLGLRKTDGETPGAFIRRLAMLPATQADPPLLEALSALEHTLYQTLYTPQGAAALPPHHGRCIRRRLRRALWRARWDALKQLPAGLRKNTSARSAATQKPVNPKKKDS